jgi:hypothetical protein
MCDLQPRVRTERRRCAPETFPCPSCGVPGRRKDLHTRTVRCLAYRGVLLIELTAGEYRAGCGCRKTSRSQVDGILPRAEHSNEVRGAVLDRLLDDKMSAGRLRRSLSRDFHLDLSDGFVYDCLGRKAHQLGGADYRRWAIERFSGTLRIDEVHLGKKALPLATDPISDFPVAFALVGKDDHGHTRRFPGNLGRWGFLPLVVVTDGSNLYPALLAEVWPAARHQLCVFHVLMGISAKALDAVKRPRRQKARRGNSGRKRKPPRRKRGVKKRRGLTAKDKAHFACKRRYLIVKRREDLSEREGKDLVRLLGYIPALRVPRQFVDRVLRLLEPQRSERQGRCRRAALLREAAFAAVPELRGATEMLSEEKFAKMVALVRSPADERVRTNNQVERVNRQLRYLEEVRDKWRRRRTIVRLLVLALEGGRQRRAGQPRSAWASPAAGRPGHPPTSSAGHRSAA